MVALGDYTRVADNEGEDVGMLSERSTGRNAPSEKRSDKGGLVIGGGRTAWWKYALGAVVVLALVVPVIAYTFSTMLENRVATAVKDALANQPAPTVTVVTTTTATTQPTVEAVTDANAPIHSMGALPVESMSDAPAGDDGHSGAHTPATEDTEIGELLTLSNGTEIEISNPYAGRKYTMHHCGGNADEARALGCSYDVMMQEWTPPECIDWTLSEKYLRRGNWTWYADPNAETVYDDYEIALGNHQVVYVDQSYHRHHCIFAWERLVRAMRTQRPLIEKLINYDHFKHCRMNTLQTFEEGAKPVRGVVAPTGFTKCASYDVWLQDLPPNTVEHAERMIEML